MLFDRINRRMKALQDQIDAERMRKGRPHDGLTTPTEHEKWKAKRDEERKMQDFQDTAPGGGIPIC